MHFPFDLLRARTRRLRFLTLLAPIAALCLATPTPVDAADLVTPYPSVSLSAGESVSFPTQVVSTTRQIVDLDVVSAPEGWDVSLLGAGYETSQILVDPAVVEEAIDYPVFVVDIESPIDAEPGEYEIVIAATDSEGTTRLPLTVIIDEFTDSPVELSTTFDSLTGTDRTAFTYPVSIENNTTRDLTFTLNPSGPSGWELEATPAAQSTATSLTVEGGTTGSINVTALPFEDAAEGAYGLRVDVESEAGTFGIDLEAQIEGEPSLFLETADEVLSASSGAGETKTIDLLITNEGTADSDEITFIETAPTDWDVEFEPESLDPLGPGETAAVAARVTTTGDAIAGDYAMSITALAGPDSSDVTLRYAVERSASVGIVALGIVAAIIGGLVVTFRRFGRR